MMCANLDNGIGLRMRIWLLILLSISGCSAGGGTGNSDGDAEDLRPPHVLALSSYQAPVGSLIEVYGTDFPDPDDAETTLVFRGTFTGQSGASYAVEEEFSAVYVDGSTLRWDTFGPYRVPFGGAGTEVGTFEGEVFARASNDTITLDDVEPTPVSFHVSPSILVTELQPVSANCGAPVTRGVGGFPYRMSVEAIGFDPESITYSVSTPNIEGSHTISIRHQVGSRYDSVGDDHNLVLPQVPEDLISYGAVFTITARATDGNEYRTAFSMTFHRPLELFYDGNVEIAQHYAPVPVSGCQPGGPTGRKVTYIEQQSESRQRSQNFNWNQNWLTSHTTQDSMAVTDTDTNSNGINMNTTDGQNWNWHVGGEVGGEAGIPLVANGTIKVNAGRDWGGIRNNTRGTDASNSHTDSTVSTDTTMDTDSEGGGEGGGFSMTATSDELTRTEFEGTVIAGTYGVFYRQATRLIRRGVMVTYNQCGVSQVVAEADFTDWTWARDLALSETCPPMPVSQLPVAECYVSPCTGE